MDNRTIDEIRDNETKLIRKLIKIKNYLEPLKNDEIGPYEIDEILNIIDEEGSEENE